MSKDEPAAGAPRFDLVTTDGQRRFVLTLKDSGVALEPDAILVRRALRWTRTPFTGIMSVTLSSGAVGRSGVIGNCTIQLNNLSRIVVSNVNNRGFANGQQNGAYRNFIRAFHQRLIASGAAKSISFRSGYSEARITGLRVALVFATAFFLVLPFVLLLISRDLKALSLLAAGAALVVPLFGVASKNAPSAYYPDRPPDLLP
jgi:hypothetical protein